MSEVERQDDSRSRFTLQVWKPIITRAMMERRGVGMLVGGGIVVAAIETMLPLMVGRIVDEARRGDSAELTWPIVTYAAVFVVFAAGVWTFISGAGRVATRTADRLRRDCFGKLQTLEPAYFDV